MFATKVGEKDNNMFSSAENRDPEYLLENEEGWEDIWGDAAVNSPYFLILRREFDSDDGMYETGGGEVRPGPEGERTEFKILCPTFLRRSVTIVANDKDAWGGY